MRRAIHASARPSRSADLLPRYNRNATAQAIANRTIGCGDLAHIQVVSADQNDEPKRQYAQECQVIEEDIKNPHDGHLPDRVIAASRIIQKNSHSPNAYTWRYYIDKICRRRYQDQVISLFFNPTTRYKEP